MKPLLIKPEFLIDGLQERPLKDMAVLVRGNLIEEVVPVDEVSALENDPTVIDAAGCTALPGLIESHAHLAMDAGVDPIAQTIDDTDGMVVATSYRNALRHLSAGVTTVRDEGAKTFGVIDVRNAIDRGMLWGPRILAPGQTITMTGGHTHFWRGEADGADGVRKITRLQVKMGADHIKFMATGGVFTPGIDVKRLALSPDEMKVIVEEAHNAGRKTSTHAIGLEGIMAALDAGVDTVEHGIYLDEEARRQMKDSGTFLIPTLSPYYRLMEMEDVSAVPQYVRDKVDELTGVLVGNFQKCVKEGMKIAAGSDAGTSYNYHGGLPYEMKVMEREEMPLMEVLQSATRVASEALDIEGQVGTLEKGKFADILIVRGDLSKDLNALDEISHVITNGRPFNVRDTLPPR